MVRPTKSDPETKCKNAIFAKKRQLKPMLFLQLHQQTSKTDTNLLQTFLDNTIPEVRNVKISRVTQQLLCSKSHDFLAVFALAHSKINQIV